MGFVNEYISEEDREKYEIDKKFVVGGVRSRQWTIDKEREIYLRQVTIGREEFSQESKWTFYWGKTLSLFKVKYLEAKGGPGEEGWVHLRILDMKIDKNVIDSQQEILNDLGAAFTAHKDAGVNSKNTSFSVQLDY